MFRSPHAISPTVLLRILIAAVLLAAIGGLAVAMLALASIQRNADASQTQSGVAVEMAQIEADLGDLITALGVDIGKFLAAPAITSLSPDQIAVIQADLLRQDGSPSSPGLSRIPFLLSLRDAVYLQRSIDQIVSKTEMLSGERFDLGLVRQQATQVPTSLENFFNDPNIDSFRSLYFRVSVFRSAAKEAASQLSSNAKEHQAELKNVTDTAKAAVIAAAPTLAVALIMVTLLIGRQIQKSFVAQQRERDTLQETSATLQYRNSQLNALYNVFTEITDTLSLRYVVSTTIREALDLVKADVVVLRLLKDNELTVAGSLYQDGREVEGLTTISLGEGLIGRVAKRGKTVRIDSSAFKEMSDGQLVDGAESGLVVPLIVGAKVVGTLGCWSIRPAAFGEDDQRILEMMASQVATTVAAADATELNERRAHRDALTGLPNRMQLSEDIAGSLHDHAEAGRPAVVAMIDIDHFKRFNDEFGHKVGDVTLQKVASVLRSSAREGDRVYRYGGEEFVLIFMGAGAAEASMLAERVRTNVEATPLTGDALEPVGPVTISTGLALLPDHASDFNVLIQLADAAMYRSKDRGRNLVTLWSADSRADPFKSLVDIAV